MCAHKYGNHHKIRIYNDDLYLDELSNFVFRQDGTNIIILGVATSEGLIPLNKQQIQFAESRDWIIDDSLDIKDQGIG